MSPKPVAAPLLPAERRAPMLGRDDQSSDTQVDVMTEEQLLRGLESMTPLEPSANIGSGGGRGERDRDPRDRGALIRDSRARMRDSVRVQRVLICSSRDFG